MTSNDKPRSVVAIIGERLKQLREEKSLRQADIAAVAATFGLSWGRSSIAALEAGTRNLSIEEFFLLPVIIGQAGGWDKPLLPPDAAVKLTDKSYIDAQELALRMSLVIHPIAPIETVPATDEDFDATGTSLRLFKREAVDDLSHSRAYALESAWRAVAAMVYPYVNYATVLQFGEIELELWQKLVKRIKFPDDRYVAWQTIGVFSYGLWGRSFADERDRRAKDRLYPTARALQSARGHVTRELITEVEAEAAARWGEIAPYLARLDVHWDNSEDLWDWAEKERPRAWTYKRWAENKRRRERFAEYPEALEVLTEIGTRLRAAREREGLSLDDLRELTGIRPSRAESMETGDFFEIAERDVAYGAIRAYAHAVRIDHQELIDEFDEVLQEIGAN